MLHSFQDGAGNMVHTLVDAEGNLLHTLHDSEHWLVDEGSLVLGAFQDTEGNLVHWFRDAGGQLMDAEGNLVHSVMDAEGNLVHWLVDAEGNLVHSGGDLVHSILDAEGNLVHWLVDAEGKAVHSLGAAVAWVGHEEELVVSYVTALLKRPAVTTVLAISLFICLLGLVNLCTLIFCPPGPAEPRQRLLKPGLPKSDEPPAAEDDDEKQGGGALDAFADRKKPKRVISLRAISEGLHGRDMDELPSPAESLSLQTDSRHDKLQQKAYDAFENTPLPHR